MSGIARASAILSMLLGCAKIAGIDDLEIDDCYGGRCDDGGAVFDGSANDDASSAADGAPPSDSGTVAVDANDGGFPSPCPGTGGPDGVRIGGSAGASACIDKTEVTADQYSAFLAAKAGNTSGQTTECAWNTSFQPSIAGTGALPVRGVDQCDAVAFCKWAGKRLCGAIPNGSTPGGPLTAGNHTNVVQNQWLNACTSGGTNAFTYGNTYKAAVCSDYQAGASAKPVGSMTECKTAAGVFDLTGNVYEWIDYCETKPGNGSADACHIMGGAFGSGDPAGYPAASYTCSIEFQVGRSYQAGDVGFRCCSP